MSEVRIDYTPLEDGTFPDVTNLGVDKWQTVRAAIKAQNLVIVISALKEYSDRTGKEEAPPPEKRISWRVYFSWLANVEPDDNQPWCELKELAEKNLREIFGIKGQSLLEKFQNDHKTRNTPEVRRFQTPTKVDRRHIEAEGRKRYRKAMSCLPGTHERSFHELYIDYGKIYGGDDDGDTAA